MLNDIQKHRITTGVVAFLAIISIYFVVKLVNEIRAGEYIGTKDTPSTISVTGDADVFAAPDIATISFTARGVGSTTKIAQTKESELVNKAIAYLKGKGIDAKDIKTSNYYAQPKYDYSSGPCVNGYCPTNQPKIVGYEANQTVDVKVRDVDTVGDLLTGLGEQGITEVSGPNFSIENEDGLKDQARAEAIKEARAKAEVLARDLGVHIVRVVNFQESNGGYYPMTAMYSKDAMNQSAGAPAPSAEIPAGQNKITSNVTISYEIR